jgi:tRNA threonylcarbamoyladenosine biosynthesis protein TsaB
MKILAIETSTLLGGVAITDDVSGLIAEVRLNVKSTHSERLMIEIDHLLKHSGLTISDIDVFAVAIGPGSFTGLRIGLSTVKGFAYATGKPIVTVPTLEALAWNYPYSRFPVCTMLDARKKEVYAALFKWDEEDFARLIDEVSTPVDVFLKNLNLSCGEKTIFTGDGTYLYRDQIINRIKDKAIFASPEKMLSSPANVATVGLKKAQAGKFSEPMSLVPFYMRKSEAEIKQNG